MRSKLNSKPSTFSLYTLRKLGGGGEMKQSSGYWTRGSTVLTALREDGQMKWTPSQTQFFTPLRSFTGPREENTSTAQRSPRVQREVRGRGFTGQDTTEEGAARRKNSTNLYRVLVKSTAEQYSHVCRVKLHKVSYNVTRELSTHRAFISSIMSSRANNLALEK